MTSDLTLLNLPENTSTSAEEVTHSREGSAEVEHPPRSPNSSFNKALSSDDEEPGTETNDNYDMESDNQAQDEESRETTETREAGAREAAHTLTSQLANGLTSKSRREGTTLGNKSKRDARRSQVQAPTGQMDEATIRHQQQVQHQQFFQFQQMQQQGLLAPPLSTNYGGSPYMQFPQMSNNINFNQNRNPLCNTQLATGQTNQFHGNRPPKVAQSLDHGDPHTPDTLSQSTEERIRTLANSLALNIITLSALNVKPCVEGDAKGANNDRAFGALMLTNNLMYYLFHRVVDKIMQKADDRIAGTLENFHEHQVAQIIRNPLTSTCDVEHRPNPWRDAALGFGQRQAFQSRQLAACFHDSNWAPPNGVIEKFANGAPVLPIYDKALFRRFLNKHGVPVVARPVPDAELVVRTRDKSRQRNGTKRKHPTTQAAAAKQQEDDQFENDL
jgi:hypothetical protein